jgi:hypothetical protein
MRTLISTSMTIVLGISSLALAQNAPAVPRITPTQAKDYVGKQVTVCGKVVDNQVRQNGISGYGFPVSFDLDEPQPNPVFAFVAFGPLGGQDEVVAAYQGKSVCVTGKVASPPSGGAPFILATNKTQIKIQANTK